MKFYKAVCLFLVLGFCCCGDNTDDKQLGASVKPPKISTTVHFVNLSWQEIVANKKENNFKWTLEFTIADGFHIQPAQQGKDQQFIPTTFEIVTPGSALKTKTSLDYKIKSWTFDGEQYFDVVSKKLTISCVVDNTAIKWDKLIAVYGILTYQACDDRKCYYPRQIKIPLKRAIGLSTLK